MEVWILGSSGGESAEVAGHNGLRFAANYHVSPATVLDAVEVYRAAFRPSADLGRPYICVSVDVVVAERRGQRPGARRGLRPVGPRHPLGRRRHPLPDPGGGPAHAWTDADCELVADRIPTQFVGSPKEVADQLERLVAATGADELSSPP